MLKDKMSLKSCNIQGNISQQFHKDSYKQGANCRQFLVGKEIREFFKRGSLYKRDLSVNQRLTFCSLRPARGNSPASRNCTASSRRPFCWKTATPSHGSRRTWPLFRPAFVPVAAAKEALSLIIEAPVQTISFFLLQIQIHVYYTFSNLANF